MCAEVGVSRSDVKVKCQGHLTITLFQGGIKAVIWTDTFQIMVITGGLLTLLIKGVLEVGSVDLVIERVKEGQRMPYFK